MFQNLTEGWIEGIEFEDAMTSERKKKPQATRKKILCAFLSVIQEIGVLPVSEWENVYLSLGHQTY